MHRDIDKRFGYRHPTMSSATLAYSFLAFPRRITSYSLCLLYMYHIPIFSMLSRSGSVIFDAWLQFSFQLIVEWRIYKLKDSVV